MLQNKSLVVDLGTSNVRVALFIRKRDKVDVLVKSVPSMGIKGGNIINPTSAGECLKIALDKLKIESPSTVPYSASVIVPGNFLVSYQVESTIEFPGITTLSHNEVNEVKNKAKRELFRGNRYLKSYYEIIHVIPQEFIVDGIDGIQNPIGRSGQKLTMRALIVLASKNHIETVKGIFRNVNLSVERFVAQPLAAFYGIRDSNFYYNNNLFIYMGSGNTEFVYFREDKPVLMRSIPAGGEDLIDALIEKLKVSRKEAERLFSEYGSAYALKVSKEEVITVNYANYSIKLPKIIVPALIQKKLQEIFKDIRSTLNKEDPGYFKNLNSVFLTGGVSKLKDIEILARRIFKSPSVIPEIKSVPLGDSSLSPVAGVFNYLISLEDREKLMDLREDIRRSHSKVGWFSGIWKFLMDLI